MDDPDFPTAETTIWLFAKDRVIVTFPVQVPLLKDPVSLGEMVPVESERDAVPVKDVAVLPLASLAVMVIEKAEPAVCGDEIAEMVKEATSEAVMSNALDVPVSPVPAELVTVIVLPVCVPVMVTLPLQTPLEKLPLVVGEIVPVPSEISTVPKKDVAVFP